MALDGIRCHIYQCYQKLSFLSKLIRGTVPVNVSAEDWSGKKRSELYVFDDSLLADKNGMKRVLKSINYFHVVH